MTISLRRELRDCAPLTLPSPAGGGEEKGEGAFFMSEPICEP
jgi:hypothetical protein